MPTGDCVVIKFLRRSLVFIIVLLAGTILNISSMEWLTILIVSGGVFAAETFNTAIEILSERVCEG